MTEYKESDLFDNSLQGQVFMFWYEKCRYWTVTRVCCSGEMTARRGGLVNDKTHAQGILSYSIF